MSKNYKKMGCLLYIIGCLGLAISMFVPFARIEGAMSKEFSSIWTWYYLDYADTKRVILLLLTLVGAIMCVVLVKAIHARNNILIFLGVVPIIDGIALVQLINSINSDKIDSTAALIHGVGYYLYILTLICQLIGIILMVLKEDRYVAN